MTGPHPERIASVPETHTKKMRRSRHDSGQNLALMLMALPGVLVLFVFAYLPMGGAIIAFKDYRAIEGILGSAWVGLKNFEFIFTSGTAWRITVNTLYLNLLFIVTGTFGSLALALLLNEIQGRGRASRWLARIYQSALFFPFFISYVIVGYFGFAILNTDTGILNRLLEQFGIAPVSWYATPAAWPLILVLVNLWKGVGFGTVIYLAGILGIDPVYYEAAAMDGATKFQQVRFITLPFLAPLVTINVLLAIGRIFFADFGLFYNVTRDQSLLYPTTDVIDTYVFRALRQLGDFGMAGAAGLYQSVVSLILVLLSNWIVRRRDPERGLF